MNFLAGLTIGLYGGGFIVTAFVVQRSWRNKLVTAAIWPGWLIGVALS